MSFGQFFEQEKNLDWCEGRVLVELSFNFTRVFLRLVSIVGCFSAQLVSVTVLRV